MGDELTRWASDDIARVPTGYAIFDDRLNGGIATGEVMLFLARTGTGKTWFAVNVVENNPETPVLFMSYEMHARYILQRLAAVHTGVPTSQIEQELRQYGESPAIDKTINDYPHVTIEDNPTLGLGDINESCNSIEAATGIRPKLVAIDFMEMIPSFGATSMQATEEVSKGVKRLAREADVAVLLLHQLPRGEATKAAGSSRWVKNEGHRPVRMSDAKYGGEVLADYVGAMYRPHLDPEMPPQEKDRRENDLRLQLLKTRTDGGTQLDGVQHHWDKRNGRIRQVRWEVGVGW